MIASPQMSISAARTSASSGSPLLSLRERSVEFVDSSAASARGEFLVDITPAPGSYQSVRDLVTALSGTGVTLHPASIWTQRAGGACPTLESAFEDVSRRATTTNWWQVEAFENYVDAVRKGLAALDACTLRVRRAQAFDLPSLRVLLTAWARLTGRGPRRLVLEMPGGATVDSNLATAVRQVAFADAAAAIGAEWHVPAPDFSQTVGVLAGVHPIAEFLLGNDTVALAAAESERHLFDVLVALRHDLTASALTALEAMERETASALVRARAASIRAVTLSRQNRTGALDAAERSVERGFSYLDGLSSAEASLERGWLFNNAALIHVLRYTATHEQRQLDLAYQSLSRALGESAAMTTPSGAALGLNASANAVRLLEVSHRFDAALQAFDRFFAVGDDPALLYRRAVLQLRCGMSSCALDQLRTARSRCRDHQWPFRLEILHATAYVLAQMNQIPAAIDDLRAGLELSLAVRSRRGALLFGTDLARALIRTRDMRLETLVEQMAEEGIDILDRAGNGGATACPVSKPASKLTSYVPELDMRMPAADRRPINLDFDRVMNASGQGVS